MTFDPPRTPPEVAARVIEKAAVVGVFNPLVLMRSATKLFELPDEIVDPVLNELARLVNEVPGDEGYDWQMTADDRRRTLAALGRQGTLLAIIDDTPPLDRDDLGRHLQAVLRQERNDDVGDLSRDDLTHMAISVNFARDSLGFEWSDFLSENPWDVIARKSATSWTW
jgi:hypothetical protein